MTYSIHAAPEVGSIEQGDFSDAETNTFTYIIDVNCFVFQSCVRLSSQVWTIVVMLLSRKFNRLPHLFALNLFLAQVSAKSQFR